jgi:hypothetical protein
VTKRGAVQQDADFIARVCIACFEAAVDLWYADGSRSLQDHVTITFRRPKPRVIGVTFHDAKPRTAALPDVKALEPIVGRGGARERRVAGVLLRRAARR